MLTLRSVSKSSMLAAAALLLHVESTSAQVSCGSVLTASTVLEQDLICAADGLTIAADGVTLDCAGHLIQGPGTTIGTGVSAKGVSGITIANCRITGFGTAVRAQHAPAFRITSSVLTGSHGGIRCTRCPGATIEGNRLEGHLTQIDLLESPDARILGNTTTPYSKGGGAFHLRYSPRAVVSGNHAPEGGAGMFLYECEDSVIEDNDLARNAAIDLWYSDRSRIMRNTLVRGSAPQPNYGGRVRLSGTSHSIVQGNRIEGSLGVFLAAEASWTPGALYVGADRNVIEDNVVSDSGLGILLFGASENTIQRNLIERTDISLGLNGLVDPNSDFDVPTDRNIVEENTIRGGLFGLGIWNASGNRIGDNQILDQWLGAYEGPTGPFSAEPNAYSGNTFAGNRFFGLIVMGGSPLIESNEFRRNGSEEPVPFDLEPFLSLVGDLRGAIALLPIAGDDFTLDNADPDDDLPANPIIGGPGGKNLFEDNDSVDIYALDTRAGNAPTLERDNHFRPGEGVHIRQDWFGLVRVEDPDGQPVSGAEVEVRDGAGAVTAAFTTGTSGEGPSSADPGRPQGRTLLEDGGPVPTWPRFTEYTIDGRGRRQDLTPHTIEAEASGDVACVTYAWDGIPGKASGSQSQDGRYQVAVVRLGTRCSATIPQGAPN